MDIRTGDLVTPAEFKNVPEYDRRFYRRVKATERQTRERKVRRNDPCPCGSGKKFKRCCLLTTLGAS